nr:hypothetical protein [Tanacetum cinerariifolium]
MARELEKQQEREDLRMNKQIAGDAKVARIHTEEEIQGMIDSLDKSNETVAKYLQEYQQFASDLSLEKKIELISNLVKYQDHYKKFMGTVWFRNDHVAAILGFVRQFCDSDLEVAFRRNACFVKNLEGVDLLKGDGSTNLYTINLYEMASASPICLMARASSTKSWLWHQRLSHLNFDTINDLAKMTLLPVFQSLNTIRNIFVLPVSKEKAKSISSTKTSSKFKAEITSSSYGFVWTNENCQYKWKAVCFGDCRRLLSLHVEPQVRQTSKASTSIADIAPTPTYSSSHATNIPITSQDVDELNSNAMVDGNMFVNPFANSSTSAAASSSSQNVDP